MALNPNHVDISLQNNSISNHKINADNSNPHLQSGQIDRQIFPQNNRIESRSPYKSEVLSQCSLCYEEKCYQQFCLIFSCEHSYCNSCLQTLIHTRIKERKQILCPNCLRHVMEPNELMLGTKMESEYSTIKFNISVQRNPELRFCPNPSCQQGTIKVRKQQKVGKCQKCGKKYCLECMLEKHIGQCTSTFNALLKDKYEFAKCPDCQSIVQRSQGCPHMTCLCGNHFCYKCGRKWGSSHRCIAVLLDEQDWFAIKIYKRLSCLRCKNLQYNYDFMGYIACIPSCLISLMLILVYVGWGLLVSAGALVGVVIACFVGTWPFLIYELCKNYRYKQCFKLLLFLVILLQPLIVAIASPVMIVVTIFRYGGVPLLLFLKGKFFPFNLLLK